MTQPIRAKQFIIEPQDPVDVTNGSVFYDSTNSNQLSYKDLAGDVTVIG